ncbi:MAG: sodium/proton-translocating pyrophosphatase, partial [Leptospiraceae bacterium]|nr:sodium/proton-translocating pyrophosphatase [Leptospiraceae bacterium]
MSYHYFPLGLGFIGLVIAFLIYKSILKNPAGSGMVSEIADQIHIGAMAFMRREYSILFIFGALITVAIWSSDLGWKTAFAFVTGALCSALAGYIGMFTATRANVRTTIAAHEKGADAALGIAFFGGSIMGLTVAAMGLMGLGFLYLLFGQDPHTAHVIHGFGMGASTVALFSRVGGGIFTKSADVGADLVGKVEAGIPEDDPRNPGVIADNVGDNVGDVAGMGSDIFESYCGSIIATIAIASSLSVAALNSLGTQSSLMFLPLALASTGFICSLIGILLVKMIAKMAPATALRIGTFTAAVLFIFASLFVIRSTEIQIGVWQAVLSGAVGGIIIGLVTEYYTGGAPVRKIAAEGETGPATVMISGLAIGMQSVLIPVLSIAAIIYFANQSSGLYGVGIAAVGML